ncbi:MAG: hypothetical protein JWM10_5322 [Myxococcaceae bacterium]|nr:hypothetical protein [Myxococcaceae bacterium]
MDKDSLLKLIATTGYNVGFGAKVHFATYDIVEKAPGWIGLISMGCGILGLVIETLSRKVPSATLLVFGVVGLYVFFYDPKKMEYEAAGRELTTIYNSLRDLYYSVKSGAPVDSSYSKLKELEASYLKASISKQVFLSDWYAHYKFFAQQQIDWVNEQKNFTLGDKVPLSLRVTLAVFAVMMAFVLYLLFRK